MCSGILQMTCILYLLDSYTRDYILLERYKGESRGGFTNLLHAPMENGDTYSLNLCTSIPIYMLVPSVVTTGNKWPVNTLLFVPFRGHGVGPQAANLSYELEAQRVDRQPFPDTYSTRYGVRSKNFFHSRAE